MVGRKIVVWSKSHSCKPKDNLQSHIFINRPGFKASFEKNPNEPEKMSCIMSGEYARIYHVERMEYVKKTYAVMIESAKKNVPGYSNQLILKRYYKWLENFNANKKNTNVKRYCCTIGNK